MSEYRALTHDELTEVIATARRVNQFTVSDYRGDTVTVRDSSKAELLDLCEGILDRHKPRSDGQPYCTRCGTGTQPWPCPDVLTVETALRNMGAL